MNTTKTTNERLAEEIEKLNWMIQVAKRDLAQTALALNNRAKDAVAQCDAMFQDKPCTLEWVSFAEGDLRRAREAKLELERLIDKQKTLTYLARNN